VLLSSETFDFIGASFAA